MSALVYMKILLKEVTERHFVILPTVSNVCFLVLSVLFLKFESALCLRSHHWCLSLSPFRFVLIFNRYVELLSCVLYLALWCFPVWHYELSSFVCVNHCVEHSFRARKVLNQFN